MKGSSMTTPSELFDTFGGSIVFRNNRRFPAIDSNAERTIGVAFLRRPGAVLLAQPAICPGVLERFLRGFDADLRFSSYIDDFVFDNGMGFRPSALAEDGPLLSKIAGQLCYLSFGPNRTMNAELDKYLTHIKESGHGSVLEHANYTFLLYGISRSLTHELVRHRVGVAYSQVSQRYVDGSKLRFVMRPETDGDPVAEAGFFAWIKAASDEYDRRAEELSRKMKNDPAFTQLPKTDQRKRVNQAARACLPNETEAPILVTMNVRTLRHLAEMRVSAAAEVEIRRAFLNVFLCMTQLAPAFFSDYTLEQLSDRTYATKTPWRRV
jgi:thymidylate synthase (FAD)